MSVINGLLRPLFDALLAPFRGLPPLAGLAVVSLLCAVGMLLIFRVTSNQKRLEQVKRQIHAGLFEIRLFNDDMVAILRAQAGILRHNLTYLRLSAVPMLWIILPLFFVIAQLQFHYGYTGLEPGRSVLLTADLSSGGPSPNPSSRPDAELVAPEGIRVETPAVWLPGRHELAWRIAPERPGRYELQVRLGGETFTKSLRVGEEVVRRSPDRLRAGLLNQLLYPAEPSLPKDGPVSAISVGYPERDIRVLGRGIHWMIVFFVLTIVFAFLLRKPLGVTI